MGNYRSEPDKTKHTVSGESDRFVYAASGMCGIVYSKIGWRLSMEDAHISIPDFTDKKFGLFAVFDGHGGTVVSNI
jgi:serine/threonine protein phosphatase PrpC